jgi:hypothetical protein
MSTLEWDTLEFTLTLSGFLERCVVSFLIPLSHASGERGRKRGIHSAPLALRVHGTTLFVLEGPVSLTGGFVGAQHAAPLRGKTITLHKSVVL